MTDILEQSPIEQKGKKKIIFTGKPLVMGRQITPLKIIIYGPNGVGKSTFASHFKNPIFIDFEQKSDHLDIDKQPIETFEEFMTYLKCLIDQDHDYSTIVIDSIDQLDSAIENYIKKLPVFVSNPKRLEFGNLNSLIAEKFFDVCRLLNILFSHKKMNIIFTGHESIRNSHDSRYPVFDYYHLKISPKASSVLCNWVHCTLFAAYEIFFEEEENVGFNKTRIRARGNDRRVLYTTGTANFLASNVFDLPHTIKLTKTSDTYKAFTDAIKNFYTKPTQEGEN